MLADNRIKASLCLRLSNWLTATEAGANGGSNMYLEENTVGGATWLSFNTENESGTTLVCPRSSAPHDLSKLNAQILSAFNTRTGTLVLDFAAPLRGTCVKVNGLQFERVYSSSAPCELALALQRAEERDPGKPSTMAPPFPPDLGLPASEHVISWIKANSFQSTQPLAQFVTAFERAGDADRAKDLRIRWTRSEIDGAWSWIWASICGPWTNLFSDRGCKGPTTVEEQRTVVQWVEKSGATLLAFLYECWWITVTIQRELRFGLP